MTHSGIKPALHRQHTIHPVLFKIAFVLILGKLSTSPSADINDYAKAPKQLFTPMESFRWVTDIIEEALETSMLTEREMVSALSSRRLSTSSCFSGVMTPELACDMIADNVKSWLDTVATQEHVEGALKFHHGWGFEVNPKCRAECKHSYMIDCKLIAFK